MTHAYAYLRTSSATNVGPDKDSDKRQRDAITAYAGRNDIEIVDEFYDASVKGSDPIQDRPGFAEMLERIAANGVRMILVETANRFARDLMVQEGGCLFLAKLGITVVPVDAPEWFTDNGDPMRKAIRQILGVMAELDKSMTVMKLKAARDRKRAATGHCEGPMPVPEPTRKLAIELRAGGLSLRAVGERLAQLGHRATTGAIYDGTGVKRMIEKGST